MTRALYPKGKELMLQAGLNMSSGTVKCALIDTGVTGYNAAHDFYNDISAAVIGTPQTLAGKTFTNGTFDSSTNPSFTGLVAAPNIEALVIFIDTGDPATSPLIYFTDSETGLPVAAGATTVNVTWDAAGIFTL